MLQCGNHESIEARESMAHSIAWTSVEQNKKKRTQPPAELGINVDNSYVQEESEMHEKPRKKAHIHTTTTTHDQQK